MSHIVAISPHLDDAAFSVGGLLAARARSGDRVTIVTCFTGNVAQPQGFALACQTDKGLGPDIDYMALRRAEDDAACAVIGADAVHLPFLEAPHRGYTSAAELFGSRRQDDGMVEPLAAALSERLAELAPSLLLGPLAIGDHVDHWVVRDALAATGLPFLLWEDWPYLRRADTRPNMEPLIRHALTDADRDARYGMCAAYASQLGFQFGGPDALARQTAEIRHENLYRP
ncbi:PIG-L deacetylase family protein [Sphingomonas montana]|uniref:PIG-L deacetylase family protein n=1 Tax=Sphingomonas montana TaxID=1843236 RepID=UPI00096C65D4|nr:PIG-L family deacetylase [Sphingomonas montana]